MKTQSILFGNGLNRLSDGALSWDDLLREIANQVFDKNIPPTLKYEAIILKQPYRAKTGEEEEAILKKEIANRVSKFKSNEAYELIADLPVGHYMTTNYDNTLFEAKGGKKAIKRWNKKEQLYSIVRSFTLGDEKKEQQYWPIHGNAVSPRSIMLGFDHYTGALSRIETYVKGGELTVLGKVTSIIKRLENGIAEPTSWIDLFFVSDVHIIGLGIGFEEIDLWWLLNKRQRIKQQDATLIQNKIIYYPVDDVPNDQRQMLDAFDIEICDLPIKSRDYLQRYKQQLKNMKARMLAAI